MESQSQPLSVETLLERLENRQKSLRDPGRTLFDIGQYPLQVPITKSQEVPELPRAQFRFLKWISRSNNSDIALVTNLGKSDQRALKIHKNKEHFENERQVYVRLQSVYSPPSRFLLQCYGWLSITRRSFVADSGVRASARGTKSIPPDDAPETLHPSFKQSWFWEDDNSSHGSDAKYYPKAHDLQEERPAILLQYLPDAKRICIDNINRDLAMQVLAGVQKIQRAQVFNDDYAGRNCLVTKDGRTAVLIDFDRAEVVTYDDEAHMKSLMPDHKDHLIEIHHEFFDYLLYWANENGHAARIAAKKDVRTNT